MAWEIWPAAPTRLAHAPRRTQVIPIPHIGRTTALPTDLRLPQDRKREGGKREREGEYLDIHLSGFRGLCRRFLSLAVIANRSGYLGRQWRRWSNLFPVAAAAAEIVHWERRTLKKILLRTLRFSGGETKLLMRSLWGLSKCVFLFCD